MEVRMQLSWLGHQTGTSPPQLRFPGTARDFSPGVNFQCRLSHSVRTRHWAIACINICAHVKDPVVHVRAKWIMETIKHPACTVGQTARLCRSWLSPGKSNPNFPWEKSHWDNTVVKSFFFFKVATLHEFCLRCFSNTRGSYLQFKTYNQNDTAFWGKILMYTRLPLCFL